MLVCTADGVHAPTDRWRRLIGTDDLICTRVAPPAWLGNQVRRDLLLTRLDLALDKRLALVHAPAGYGKTSLLSQWRETLNARGIGTAWLTLEHADTDALRLAHYIALALDPNGEHGPLDLPPRAALSAIINRLVRDEREIVLIFDDVDRAHDAEVGEFLRALIRLAPGNCHFVVSSRDYPSLGQSAFAAADQVVELTMADLRFSDREAAELLDLQVELGDGDLDRIMERTEGWPIALQLTALSIRRGVDRRTLMEHVGGPRPELGRYLSEQVLMALPEDARDILLITAVLDRLTGEAINFLCDRHDGWLLLERFEQQGVALTPLDIERSAFRYHQLFAEYLRDRLHRHDPVMFRAVHRKACGFYAARGDVVEAIGHALASEDADLLAATLEDAGAWRLIPQGLQSVVERSLAALPPAVVNARWRLRLARIYLRIKQGEMAAARADYDDLTSVSSASALSADAWIEVRVVGDTLADYENLPMTLEDLLGREALLRTLPADDHLVQANVTEALGAKYVEGGWLERALEPTLAAREHYRALGSLYSELFTHFQEARIRRAQGRITDAAKILADTRASIHAGFGEQSDLAAHCAAFEAELLFEQHRDVEALQLLDWALPHMEQSDGWVDIYQAAYGTAARATAAAGDLESARALLARARRLSLRRRLPQLEQLADIYEIEIALDHANDPSAALAARDWLEQAADTMAQESPRFRPVSVAATLASAKLALAIGDPGAAAERLERLRRWAGQHGAGRLLVDANLLLSAALRSTGGEDRARDLFDEAVGTAMFHGLSRPFVDQHRHTRIALREALERSGDRDRFRTQFLRGLERPLKARAERAESCSVLNGDETDILVHLSHGLSNKEIARRIGMSPDTVKYRLKSIFRKIGVHSRRDAVRISYERGYTLQPGTADVPAQRALT